MAELEIIKILSKFIKNNQLSSLHLKLLEDDQADHQYPLKSNNNFVQQKLDILSLIHPKLNLLFHDLKLTNKSNNINNIWNFWLPLALELVEKKRQKNYPFTVGILGGQGTGKTTLTQILPLIWQSLNLSSVGISLDDLYKTYEERQKLLNIDSRLIWRGPPGTHDINLGIKILDQLHQGNYPVDIPRFDKSLYDGSGDRIAPQKVNKTDIIILEGWFIGVQPVSAKAFSNPPYPIVTQEDKKFALDCNERLKEYLPLWEKLDYLMIFNPEDYRFSLQWRKTAEHEMINQGKTGMSDKEIEKFVHYFWKALHPQIYIESMTKNPLLTDLVVNINYDHTITKIDRPSQTDEVPINRG